MANQIKQYIKLIRPHQWVKNFFIFLPVFFSFRFTEVSLFLPCILAFLGFSFIASSIYIINDWCDIESDKAHPTKRKRPLASGAVKPKEALIGVCILLAAGFGIYTFAFDNWYAIALLGLYFILNIFYSFKLKHITIVDITIVAIGFVIRVFIGGVVTGIAISQWLIIMIFLLALLLAVGKRRDDVLIFVRTGDKSRKNIDGYNLNFLNSIIVIITAIIILAYIMYTISPEVVERNGDNLYLTSLFVILGLMRYLQIIFVDEKSGDPTKIFLKDHFIHIVMLLWVASFLIFSLVYKS